MRRGYTLLEVLVASALGLGVLATAFAMFVSTNRMSGAGDLGKAMADASIAMEYIHRDLIQAVQRPGNEQIVRVSPETAAAQLLVAERDAEGALKAHLVVYRREGSGTFRLIRRERDRETPLPGTYAHVGFTTLVMGDDPASARGRVFVRVTLHARARPEGGAPTGSDEAVLTSLVRVAGPEMLNAPTLRWDWMDGVKSADFVKGQLGF